MKSITLLFISLLGWFQTVEGQTIPSDKVLSNQDLASYLTSTVQQDLKTNGAISEADLARFFRTKFTERYFYNWETNEKRFKEYTEIYPEAKINHTERALDHLAKFPAKAQWELPFNYQNGDPVNAYALRHLARQHKMIDIGYYYFYQNKDEQYLDYFTEQLASLNTALVNKQYERIEDGNGVYEAFRSGYRMINWLQLHSLFLGQSGYSDAEQLVTIATFLQHAQHLYEHNKTFKSGNHQTRGLSALAMLSIVLRDFKGADEWYKHSMTLLGEHLDKEINDDGFQFERTIHYHMSDIGTYFYVYQLAKKSKLPINPVWENKLESLFTTLTKIAFPDKSAPVLSDDTDAPWAVKNDISGAMTLGYLLFEDPEMGYFAKNKLSTKFYWDASAVQLEKLKNINSVAPKHLSLSFPDTGYYIMREGWNAKDNMMVISAGLDPLKPDHQHGDILGVQAMANGQVVLPNYQVRYSLKDLELFKNSMTKNVALVDNELLGKQYTSNKGGSGFGKFKQLAQPKVIAFDTSDHLDVFVGSHDGFENIGVDYNRQVITIKNDFWIVKDNFKSKDSHEYKQVWQGHYTEENGADLLRSSFDDGSGLDIFQLNTIDKVETDGARGKEWSVVSKSNAKQFSFITIVYPFETYDKRIDEDAKDKQFSGWKLNASKWIADNSDAVSLTKEGVSMFFSVKTLEFGDTKIKFEEVVDVLVNTGAEGLRLQLLSKKECKAEITQKGVKQKIKCSVKAN
ncbi:heparinase II/III family protein [Psychroserpens sp. NJDZ02]|uniref:heparinase II/III family protein n=1 Tax=Psychroserpens sp. NJDZ02 TaxID=2570561 RepID=UPI0010A87D54|nr:heparinase II/III family protein [Psychroserpens sp. NJDZ02]QCE41640.1 heparinase [Psychroserpens sp. NJDZ02]